MRPLTLVSPVFAALTLAITPQVAGADAKAFKLDPPPQGIYGGTEVAACGWPTTVSVQGSCTGTLVHPQVVIFAAHCGSGYSSIQFGEKGNSPARSVPTQSCATFPNGGPGGGNDFAYCVLTEPQMDLPIVPPLMGCETEVLTPGREVTIVGFGNADNGPYGIKREVVTTINAITGDDEASIGGNGKDSCQGDSGGPVYVKLPAASGSTESWRVFGITSYGGSCGSGGYYSMMHNGMAWFESETGVDLTPCHDADGTWNPGPDCRNFPMDPGSTHGSWGDGCAGGPLSGYEAVCGAPFNSEPDTVAPTVAITLPADLQMFMSDPMTGTAAVNIEATADDGTGWGVQSVTLVINGAPQTAGEDFAAPYGWNSQFPPGIFELSAQATDYAGNVGTSAIVTIGVDMQPQPDPGGTDGTGSGGSAGGTDGGGTGMTGTADGGPNTGSGTGGGGEESGDDDKGCGCSTERGGAKALPLLALVPVLRRRRRR